MQYQNQGQASGPPPTIDDTSWRPHMAQSIGRVEGKLDQLIISLKVSKDTSDDHEVRIRVLEKGAWKRAGFVGAIAAFGGTVFGYLVKHGWIPS